MDPKWTSLISKYVGMTIMLMSGSVYVSQLVTKSIDEVAKTAITAFGLIAALSGLCFAIASNLRSEHDKDSAIYAGEKLLHSSLLMIQTLFLKYASDMLLQIGLIKSIFWISKVITLATSFVLTGVGGYSIYFSYYGFDALNDVFWNRYEARRKKGTR